MISRAHLDQLHKNWVSLTQRIADCNRNLCSADHDDILDNTLDNIFDDVQAQKELPATLLAVTKNQSADYIIPLLKAGQMRFGENRVQEAYTKWPLLKAEYPNCQLHLIGPLQTNKVREAIALFDVIETVDRINLADKIADELGKNPKPLQLLIQVNIGHEPQKSGVLPDDFPALFAHCRARHLPIMGLMCIPPANQNPVPFFQNLAHLAALYHLPILSMGMSHDFETAIEYGASWVRIGSALFQIEP